MIVYALTHTVGYATGYSKLVGIYSTPENAEEAKQKCDRFLGSYSITPIEIDKTVNITYADW